MDWHFKLSFAAFLVLAPTICTLTHGLTIISGTVFCDQCKDGQISLFDYPVSGIKVAMACPDGNGQLTTRGEETTNWLGTFNMRFDETSDLSNCFAQVSGSGQASGGACGAVSGPARPLKLMYNMFGMAMYAVDTLISQPVQPMSFCPSSSVPVPGLVPVTPPPKLPSPPAFVPVTPPPTMPSPPAFVPVTPPPKVPSPPAFVPVTPPHKVPSPPALPILPPMPPFPFLEASACPYGKWMMPEYRCYWKVVSPDTKVGVVFGLLAARKYGMEMTLWEGLNGRGEAYKTLLREGTTALLNSYNSVQYPYNPLGVVERMNWALMAGSTRQVLHTALSFMKANYGFGHPASTCRFTSCTPN
ncbi:unnamed protein product [Cuscuta epithymum]|uniref:Uncharacterized protein n=2 Tax=Cuscuta epithymum TaxID=186058 RepID=A0AAV0ERQ0_9ASTE|nr:unnamed protein product [Cuscuta epithymum]